MTNATTIVYMVVCDNGTDKYVEMLDSYGGCQTVNNRDEAIEERNSLQEAYPHNTYYIKDVIL